MTDDELKDKVVNLIYRRFSKFHKEFPIEGRNFGLQWTKILDRVGCTSYTWSWDYPEDDTDDLFVRHPALGVIRVPREVAMKILVLGGLP